MVQEMKACKGVIEVVTVVKMVLVAAAATMVVAEVG